MTERSRRAYLGLGRTFVVVGAGVALVSLVDRAASWGFFRASPIGTAAFLALVGVLLLRTVRQAEHAGQVVPDVPPGGESGEAVQEGTPTIGEDATAATDGEVRR